LEDGVRKIPAGLFCRPSEGSRRRIKRPRTTRGRPREEGKIKKNSVGFAKDKPAGFFRAGYFVVKGGARPKGLKRMRKKLGNAHRFPRERIMAGRKRKRALVFFVVTEQLQTTSSAQIPNACHTKRGEKGQKKK